MLQMLILKKFLKQRRTHTLPVSPDNAPENEPHLFSKNAAGVIMFLLVFFFLLMIALFESPIYG